jgi:ergothioneine biosynthesis protein EgtB
LGDEYLAVRLVTDVLCQSLNPEDMAVQSMPDCSPTKWHLAHTTWFFEQFVLAGISGYTIHHPAFAHLFNSYYLAVGQPYPRASRGLLTRPTARAVTEYRRHVDAALATLLGGNALPPSICNRVVVGLHHERQHQELMLTDLQHLFSANPLRPAYRNLRPPDTSGVEPLLFQPVPGGQVQIGAGKDGFSFDNERPIHYRYVPTFALANRPVTNSEYRQFIDDGGYRRASLWLADGWEHVQSQGWGRPLYWDESLDCHFTLGGTLPLDPDAPVGHVSGFEADAFARWSGARLPREEEWELAARNVTVDGNFLESGALRPRPSCDANERFVQLFGDVWEWTQSPYIPYPGFKPDPQPLDEYNGKFMSGQMVLRGGSCLSPRRHIRATYRNFLPASARWQVSGIRLAADP